MLWMGNEQREKVTQTFASTIKNLSVKLSDVKHEYERLSVYLFIFLVSRMEANRAKQKFRTTRWCSYSYAPFPLSPLMTG